MGCREGFEDEGEDLAWLAAGWREGGGTADFVGEGA